MRPVVVCLLLVATAGCEKKKPPPPLSEVETVELRECLDALAEISKQGGVTPDRVAAACPSACPGFSEAGASLRLATVIDRCDFACPRASELGTTTNTGEKLSRLYDVCGEKHYGLPKPAKALLSPDWYVVHAVGRWIGERRARTNEQQLLDAIDAAQAGLTVPLPVPSESSLAELARASQAVSVSSDLYLVVDSDGVQLGAWPVAGLGERGARLLGADVFPGQSVAIESLAAAVAERREAAPPADDTTVFVIADRRASAARVLQAVVALGGADASLGVASMGPNALAHSVQLSSAGDPVLAIEITPEGIAIATRDGDARTLRSSGGEQDWPGLRAALDTVDTRNGVSIAARGVPVQQLVAALDLLALRGVPAITAIRPGSP